MLQFFDLTLENRGQQGWILYTQKERVRNRHYIDLYRNACERYGLSLKLGIYDPVRVWDEAARLRLAAVAGSGRRPDFVINRTRDYMLAAELERRGITVYNHSSIAELGNDKAKACRFMEQSGIAVMPTVYGVQNPPWYPAVIKSADGHGGTEVYWISDRQQMEHWKRTVRQPRKEYLIQQAASDLGRDVRVYLIGDEIAASVLRSCDHDFRSNFCLGGSVSLYELSEKERGMVNQIVSKIVSRLTAKLVTKPEGACGAKRQSLIGMAGIDFIFHHGQMVFNEIEDMAGARSLYSLSDYDIVDAYVEWIWKRNKLEGHQG